MYERCTILKAEKTTTSDKTTPSELMEAALIKPLGETPTPVLKNCYLAPRQGETMFFKTADAIIPNLDGYAIIPREDYEKLRVLAGMELTSPHP